MLWLNSKELTYRPFKEWVSKGKGRHVKNLVPWLHFKLKDPASGFSFAGVQPNVASLHFLKQHFQIWSA